MSRGSAGLVVLAVMGLAVGSASAMTMSAGDGNIVELLSQSSDIVVGRVDSVTDGLDERGIPYTEVTLKIAESIRGELSGDYKFRQFGLLKPRVTEDGIRMLMPGPTGFPKYSEGEDVVLFLRPGAAWTGFRMPAAVTHGKFTISAGRAENGMANAGLFRNVKLDRGLTTELDKRLLATATGPVNPDAFLSFVRRAVLGRWVETDRMSRSDRHDGPRMPPRANPRDAHDQTSPAERFTPNPQALRDPNESILLPGPRR